MSLKVMEDEDCTFKFETHLPLSQKEAFMWHTRPAMLERLSPPFINTRLISKDNRLEKGDVAMFKFMIFGNVGIEGHFEIVDLKEGQSFTDIQTQGPFSYWKHHHKFQKSDSASILEDEVHFKLPLDSILGGLLNSKVTKRLKHLFEYRKEVLLNDMDFAPKYPKKKLHILVTGANGLIGSSLVPFLKMMGHYVMPITRHLRSDEEGVFWDIENQKIDPQDLEGYDAVIHLAGENIAGLWTESKKEKILKSRIDSTRLLVKTLNQLRKPPKTFICASGCNFYPQGERSTEENHEGEGFLTDVIARWEKEASQYKEGRVAHMRTGVVLSPKGGMLKKLLNSYELGLGATLGEGQNHLSWIGIDDLVYQYYHVLMTSSLEGPINATSPHPVTSKEFSETLAMILNRPLFLKIPKGVIESIFGQMGKETLLADLRVYPQKLIESQSSFYFPELGHCLKHLLGVY